MEFITTLTKVSGLVVFLSVLHPALVLGITTPDLTGTAGNNDTITPPNFNESLIASTTFNESEPTFPPTVNISLPTTSASPNISISPLSPTPDKTSVPTTSARITTVSTTTKSGCYVNYSTTVLPVDFTSPNYPNNYDNDMYCEYRFNVSSSKKKRAVSNYGVQLNFQSFELEYEKYCLYDFIEIYDGPTKNAPFIGRYCGTDIPAKILGSKSTLLVVFSSDSSYTFKGFTLQHKEEDISYPNCKASYTNQINASPAPQTIQNSDYPGTYAANTDEYFLIINSATLILQLVAMDIERSKGCIYDRIIIYDGACPSFGILYEHCGTFKKRWELTGPEYLIQFHTDSSVQKTGFQMEVSLGVAGTGPVTTTTTTIGPPVEAEISVMSEVLTNYTVDNFPSRDLSTPIGTKVDMFLVGINDLDEVQQKLTTTILIDAQWQDDVLMWETSKQGGVIKLLIPQNDVWKPDLALLNGFESLVQFGDKFMFVVCESNGSCEWRPYQIMASTCNVDMTYYPYDTQNCDLRFSTWSSKADQVNTTIGSKGMEKHEYYIENSHWTLLSISQNSEIVGAQSVVTFTLTLKRNPAFIVFYVAIPVVMLALLNAFTFILPPASGEKSSLSMIVFLSFVVYVIVAYQKMPENSDNISLFALYILIMAFISSLTVMITILELRLVEINSKYKAVPSCAKSFSKSVSKLKMKVLCVGDKFTENRIKGLMEDNIQYSWLDFVSALDFVLFWLFFVVTIGVMLFFLIYLAAQ